MTGKSSIALAAVLAGAVTSAFAAPPTAPPPAPPPVPSSQTAAADAAERERIVRERTEAQAAFVREEAACQDRFLVTPCVDAARKTEREVLARLRRQEVLLDEQARKQRAAERTQAIRNSISADEARSRDEAAAAASAASAPPRRVERSDLAETPGRTERPRRELPAPLPPSDAAARRAAAQEHAERYTADKRAAQAHREAVERRNAERAASGKVAAPLPTPSGASAP